MTTEITPLGMQSYLEGATANGLVKVKPIGDGLFVLKYTKKAFFGGLFDDYLEECRGTIIDGDFMPVVLPFRKIYNFGVEERAPKIGADEIVRAYRKINGFMLAVTLLEGELLVSTTGSTTSDFVGYGKELIAYCEARVGPWKALLEPGFTYLFEAVHELDPHVVPEVEGLYFLGRRETRWGSQIEVPEGVGITLGCIGLSPMLMSFAALEKEAAICNHEGYVVYVDDGIFNLGDVSFGTEEQTIDYLSRLRGKKVLIYGNHDQVIQRSPRVQSMFDEIHTELTIWKGKTGIYMHHFAHRVWNKSHFGDIHLYGHSHNALEHTPWGKSMDVGIDARPNGDMKPWTLDEIMDIMATRKILDHHDM